MAKTSPVTALVAAALACALAAAAPLAAQETGTEYRIGPKDLLEISVLGVPEINKLVVRVSEQSRITLPLLGEVEVGDLTKFEVEKKPVSYTHLTLPTIYSV